MRRKLYTLEDLDIIRVRRNVVGEVSEHTHTVKFGRPLSPQEQMLFARLMDGFYYAVHFSRRFGDNLVAEPTVAFPTPDQAEYTLRQRGMAGAWKDLLFAMLATFSEEIAPIRRHDRSRAFDPERELAPAH